MSFKSKALVALVDEQLAFLKLKPLNLRKLTEEQKNQIFAECKMVKNTKAFDALVDFYIEQFKDRIIKDIDPDYNRAGLLMIQGFRQQIYHLANQYDGESEQPND